jgi:hypothetical protein
MIPKGITKFLFTQLTIGTRQLDKTLGVEQLVENFNMPFMAFSEPTRPFRNVNYCFTLDNSFTE